MSNINNPGFLRWMDAELVAFTVHADKPVKFFDLKGNFKLETFKEILTKFEVNEEEFLAYVNDKHELEALTVDALADQEIYTAWNVMIDPVDFVFTNGDTALAGVVYPVGVDADYGLVTTNVPVGANEVVEFQVPKLREEEFLAIFNQYIEVNGGIVTATDAEVSPSVYSMGVEDEEEVVEVVETTEDEPVADEEVTEEETPKK